MTVAFLLQESPSVLKCDSFALDTKARQTNFPLKMLLFRNVSLRDLGRSFHLSLDILTAILFLLLSLVLHVSWRIHQQFLEIFPFGNLPKVSIQFSIY